MTTIASPSVLSGPATGFEASSFETVYADAAGDATCIPWDAGRASPSLVNWLNAVAPSLVRCGARVAVVGCGLGHDARALINRGYEVTAFDCSPSAIEWAQRLDPAHAHCYVEADLFEPPSRWRHRFDLVVENETIGALPAELHASAFAAITELLAQHGHLLVIAQGRDEAAGDDDGLTERDLLEAAAVAGLAPIGAPGSQVASFLDDEEPPVRRLRALFRRA